MNFRAKCLIAEYLKTLEKQKKIIKELYDNTGYFENKYQLDFEYDIWRFFAKKLNMPARQFNDIKKAISKKEDLIFIKKIKNDEIIKLAIDERELDINKIKRKL